MKDKLRTINYKKYMLFVFMNIFIMVFSLNNIFAASYIYNYQNGEQGKKIDSSSISTIATPEFSFQSAAQILMEPTTGTIIYANNEDEKLLPASVTKIMTLLLIMEQIDSGKMTYEDKVTCSAKASGMGGSQIWFKEGEQLSIDEALKAICVVSANDVTVAMAELIGGSEENFVKMMNDKALQLGMMNTHFMNSHGIDEDNHYTTAKDIALMSRELIIKHPNILKYTSIWMDTLRNGTFALSSTNKLIRFYEGATGLKTGSTSKALFNLSATATRNNTTFISVVMKAPSSDIRLEETKQLLNFAFANYEVQNICASDAIIDTRKVNKNINSDLDYVIKSNITSLVEKGTKIDFDKIITYDENVTAPVKKDQVVGKIQIIDKTTNNVIGESELIAKNDIQRSKFSDYIKKIFNIFIMNTNS